jgi:hypothetical protein
MQCRAPSTSLCGYDASFGAGLLEAVAQVEYKTDAVMLIAYDHPYPVPIGAVRSLTDSFGVALVLAPGRANRALAEIEIEFVPRPAEATALADPGLEAVRASVPAARSLPLLAALAGGRATTLILEGPPGAHLRVEVMPCR